MRNTRALWPTLKRLLAYGAPWRNSLIIAVIMLWVAAAAEVSGPALISYFIDLSKHFQRLTPIAHRAGSKPTKICAF